MTSISFPTFVLMKTPQQDHSVNGQERMSIKKMNRTTGRPSQFCSIIIDSTDLSAFSTPHSTVETKCEKKMVLKGQTC